MPMNWFTEDPLPKLPIELVRAMMLGDTGA
jgi:hypothetical protein